jgi:hypothetical protein
VKSTSNKAKAHIPPKSAQSCTVESNMLQLIVPISVEKLSLYAVKNSHGPRELTIARNFTDV